MQLSFAAAALLVLLQPPLVAAQEADESVVSQARAAHHPEAARLEAVVARPLPGYAGPAALRPVPNLPESPFGGARERAASGRVVVQVALGAIAAAGVGLVAWSALDDPEGSDRRVKGDAGYTPNANTAYALGSYVGCTVVVYTVGRGDGSRGSFLATALGAGAVTVPLLFGRNEPYLPLLGLLVAPLQSIGGTLGYRRTRARTN